MRNKMRLFRSLLVVGMVFAYADQRVSAQGQPISQPNVILILADDQGWGSTSVMMAENIQESESDFIRTPNLERLAAKAVVYSNGYAGHPNCSPTRASILTGKSPAKLQLTDIIERHTGPLYEGNKLIPPPHIDGLPDEEITLAEVIKSNRPEYATAHFGKWHLGNGGPEQHGFDASDGATSNGVGNRKRPENPKDIFGITDRAIKWMREQSNAEKPFYMQLSHYATHSAIQYKTETFDKVRKRTPGERHAGVGFAAMSEDLDTGVGLILDELERLGIADNTYIIYLADNGAQATRDAGNINGPLHGWKATVWEGGIRVPFLIAGPGIVHAYSTASVVSYDLYPTICDWLGIRDLPVGIEGGSLVNSLEKPRIKKIARESDVLVFHFPHYQLQKGSQPATAIIKGDYKLIKCYEDNSFALFNLKKDISEVVDLAKGKPNIVRELSMQMERYLTKINAGLPTMNNDYDEATDPGRKFYEIKEALRVDPYPRAGLD